MASTDALPIPRKNVAFRVTFPILDADGDLVTGAAGLDSEVSKDGGTFADCTNEATEIATNSGMYFLDLTSTEMNADCVAVIVKTSTSGGKTTPMVFYPLEDGDWRVNVVQWLGTAASTPTVAGVPNVNAKTWNDLTTVALPLVPATAGRTLVVDAAGLADANVVKVGPTGSGTAQTAGDIIGDTNDIQTRLPAALVSGRIDASVGAMAAGVLTATAIAADAITDAKVASDVTIASVTGAVGSVTGAVGSVTGAVGSVTGNVGGNVVGTVASVVGAVGSVTGNVGGNVTGSVGSVVGAVGSVTGAVGSVTGAVGSVTGAVGSVAAGGITAASIATGAIDADSLAADAVAEIADGVHDEVVDGATTFRESTRLANSANGGKLSGAATATVAIRDLADTKDRVSASVDASGNRTAVTRDLT